MTSPDSPKIKKTAGRTNAPLRIAIVGAGISGICAGIRFKRAHIDNFIILEKAERIGGTWRDNTYPGAACDIPSHLYSYSFAPKANWSRKYPTQPELLSYLENCVRSFGIETHIQFNSEVVSAHYQDSCASWLITLAGGDTIAADVLITGCGQLHHPMIPDIPGKNSFSGAHFHSARWRHDCDLSNRSVAIIGSAASAVQIAPAIAPKVHELRIFQRSPNWILPGRNKFYSEWTQALFNRFRTARKLYRTYQYCRHELLVPLFRAHSLARWVLTIALRAKMQRKIRDKCTRKAILPKYPIGCKRVLRAPEYLRLFRQDKAILVSVAIDHIAPEGIVTRDGKIHRADVIIYATGFKTLDFLAPIDIRGRAGIRLADAWAQKAEAYLGMAVPDFPNFFILYGPNTNLGHNSVIFMIERQVDYMTKMLQYMHALDVREVELRSIALNRFTQRLATRMRGMVWSGACQSYYKNDDDEVVSIWPYSTLRYWWATRLPRIADYVVK